MLWLLPLVVIKSFFLSSPKLYTVFTFCFMLGRGYNLISARAILLFFCVCKMCNIRELVQGQRCYGNINNYPPLHEVMSTSICSAVSDLYVEYGLGEYN